jgi:hypothetical protein
MDLLSTGDGSGRPETSGVCRETAYAYAVRMYWASPLGPKLIDCRQIHRELNGDEALYQLALDLFREKCRRGGAKSGYWKEHTSDD